MQRLLIPYGVTEIKPSEFSGRTDIEEVIMPSTVTLIGECAFAHCSNLRSVQLSPNLVTIGRGAFKESGLTQITLPASLKSVGAEAFSHCSSLKLDASVMSVQEWGDAALYGVSLTAEADTEFVRKNGFSPLYELPSDEQRLNEFPWATEHEVKEDVIPSGKSEFSELYKSPSTPPF